MVSVTVFTAQKMLELVAGAGFTQGTRAELDAIASSNGLILNQPLWISDEGTLAVATSTSSYTDFVSGPGGGGGEFDDTVVVHRSYDGTSWPERGNPPEGVLVAWVNIIDDTPAPTGAGGAEEGDLHLIKTPDTIVTHDTSPDVGDFLKVVSLNPLVVEGVPEPSGGGGGGDGTVEVIHSIDSPVQRNVSGFAEVHSFTIPGLSIRSATGDRGRVYIAGVAGAAGKKVRLKFAGNIMFTIDVATGTNTPFMVELDITNFFTFQVAGFHRIFNGQTLSLGKTNVSGNLDNNLVVSLELDGDGTGAVSVEQFSITLYKDPS